MGMKAACHRMIMLAIGMVLFHIPWAPVWADDGHVGIYGDPQGTAACASVPPYTAKTLYVLATTSGASTSGLTGAEFRVEVANPAGWFFSYNPPSGATPLGSLIDTDPGSDSDGSGLNIAFTSCQMPDSNGKIALGVINVFNAGGSPTSLLVKRHTNPSNSNYTCPAFVLCDSPVYSMICMTPSTEAPCSLSVAKNAVVRSLGDLPVFAMGLNAEVETTPRDPTGRVPVATEVVRRPTLVSTLVTPDIVADGLPSNPSKVLQETLWVADWSFNAVPCNGTGWTRYDNRVLNNGQHYWSTNAIYDGTGGIVHNAAVLRSFSQCWADTGYGSGWDQSLRLNYRGTGATLSFDVLLDTEPNDNMTVEADVGCASQANSDPSKIPEDLRTRLPGSASLWGGAYVNEHVTVTLPNTAVPSCVYIRFSSDGDGSDEDGSFRSSIRAGLVIDNLVVTGEIAYSEDFESQTWNANVVPVNSAPSLPVSDWVRVYQHVTDNDRCTENTTCSWLFTDPLATPNFADMAFGPGGAIIRNWLDDVLVSPWVDTQRSGAGAGLFGTVLSFLEFPGNEFHKGEIMRSWSVRGKTSGSCISPWSNDLDAKQGTWQDLSTFSWVPRLEDVSLFTDTNWDSVQVRFRVSDWQYIFGNGPPATLNTGPGPYIDRVRIGRLVLTGPVISEGEDSRSQAQDDFPDFPLSRHGTTAFSASVDLASQSNPNVIRPDSIWVSVVDRRGTGGIADVRLYAVVVAGPHAGKAPPPYTVAGDSTFFSVVADSCRNPWGAAEKDKYFVDFDDQYFRGGDVLRYFWLAIDAAGGVTSDPPGIPRSPEEISGFDLATAERLTGGLLEVNFLPTINWVPHYLARIAADPHGKLDPTAEEIAGSHQSTCILYVNKSNLRRLSTHRTSYIYTLDRLGYRGSYDVYDLQGFGNTRNDLMSRCTTAQAAGYALIVHDAGRTRLGGIPDGRDSLVTKLEQDAWYRQWLEETGVNNEHGMATLWVIGDNVPTTTRLSPLIGPTMGIDFPAEAGLVDSAKVLSDLGFSFVQAIGYTPTVTFPSFVLGVGCRERKDYDSFTPSVDARATHRFQSIMGPPAVGMRARVTLSDGGGWTNRYNTIMMPFSWVDVAELPGVPYVLGASLDLARAILNNALPIDCVRQPSATGIEPDGLAAVPRVTVLRQNMPNPFNPTTVIGFDLGEDAVAKLKIYDLGGRLVRTLIDSKRPAGRHQVTWDGKNEKGHAVASGVYLYELRAGRFRAARKLVVLR